jgi:hypothetical protein
MNLFFWGQVKKIRENDVLIFVQAKDNFYVELQKVAFDTPNYSVDSWVYLYLDDNNETRAKIP